MSRKRVLTPYRLVTDGSLGADFYSPASTVSYDDNVGYQVKYAGNPVGEFFVQGTINGEDWEDLELSAPIEATGIAGSFVINLNQIPYYQLRLRFDHDSGTGFVQVWIMTKTVGA
jgi:hypothetical protein